MNFESSYSRTTTVLNKEQDMNEPESCRIPVAEGDTDKDCFSMASLDRLDRMALLAILLLSLAAIGLVIYEIGREQTSAGPGNQSRQNIIIISPELEKKTALAKTLLNAGNLPKARELIDSLIKEYPFDGAPFMLLGDLYLHRQQPIQAMLAFRRGVDLNPDYLDKKMTAVFQGKKIKGNLEEARQAIDGGLLKKPGDPTLKEHREVLYYMLRKVAGSCG